MSNFQEKSNFIWNLADLLRGSFKFEDFHKIILPFTVLKRLDSLLQYSKQDVLDTYNEYYEKIDDIQSLLLNVAVDEEGNKLGFYNYSKYDLNSLLKNEGEIEENMLDYLECFSDNIKDIFSNFDFKHQIIRLSNENLLDSLVKKLNKNVDLSPMTTSHEEMGIIFEGLINRFLEDSRDIYGPQGLLKLIAELIPLEDEGINEKGLIKKIYDPACGTGRLLACCKDSLIKKNSCNVELYGQDVSPEIYALCKANLLMRGEQINNIKGPASSISNDQFKDEKFDYIICNPPFGVNWEYEREFVENEAKLGFDGRFGAGIPRKRDGQLLFLQHMISKMKPKGEKSKIVFITNDLPLFIGDIGSGESDIRKWIFENDYIETLIALPSQLIYGTSMETYVWVLTNEKSEDRVGKVQLIDARQEFDTESSKEGKRHILTEELIKSILKLYNHFEDSNNVKIYDNVDFGYKKIVVERPMQLNAQVADPNLREYKKLPINQNIENYLEKNIFPFYKNAWVDESRTKIGYEINFNQLMFDERSYFDDIDFPIVYLDELITLKKIKTGVEGEFDLYIKSGGNFKKVFFYPDEIPADRKNKLYRHIGCKIKSERITKEYLYFYFNSNKGLKQFSYLQRTRVINLDSVLQMKIPLPDIKTQKEIVETYRLVDRFFNEIDLWRTNFYNNILNYKQALEVYKDFSCSIKFSDDGGVSDFCHNWRIVYQGLIWPLAYTYLKATKGSKEESTIKKNLLIFFEFITSFNTIVLISGINNSMLEDNELENIKEKVWALKNNNPTTWHRMAFGSWTTLFSRISKDYRKYNIETPIEKKFFKKLSIKKYGNLFDDLRDKERNSDVHSGFEDDIDVETKLEDLKKYVDTDIFEILNIYSGLKLYYVSDEIKRISPKKISHKVLDLNGPCDPQYWHDKIYHKELDPHCLYLYDPLTNSYLKLDDDLIKFRQIPDSRQYGIYIYDGIINNKSKKVAKYKCYQRKNEYWEIELFTEEDTYFKVSEEFKKDVLRL